MEDILASIRRIVAEDGGAAGTARRPDVERHDEILELTEMVGEDGTVVSIAASGQQKSGMGEASEKHETAEPVLGRNEPAVPVVTPPVEPEPPPLVTQQPAPSRHAERLAASESLVSSATVAASAAALSQLAAHAKPQRSETSGIPLGATGRTLEELVRDLLRPMLKDWLDANLPQLVERLVQNEIQRMVRDSQDR